MVSYYYIKSMSDERKKTNWTWKLKPLGSSKDTTQKITKQHRKWKKIFVNHIPEKRLESKLYKALFQHSKKMNKPLKNGQKIWIDTSPKRYTCGQ